MTERIRSIDITRGFVMVIMALDHVREFWHKTAMTMNPTDLQTTTTAIFFTRWVTHICAPAFVFLAGVSAYLSFRRTNDAGESRKFLLTRGLWLILLEFTLINFALWFDIHFRLIILEVIGAIGFSFIILSLMLRLGSGTIGLIGLLIIFFHNLLQGTGLPENKPAAFLISMLLRPNMVQFSPDFSMFTAYPVIPWLGIMLSGYGCGKVFELSPERRKRIFLITGIAAILLFSIIRSTNLYGDPASWSEQKSGWFTFLSFINVTKYPPSLLFVLLFTGLMFISLFFSEKAASGFAGFLEVFGRVPFFYFVIHLYLIHALMFIMLFTQGFGIDDFVFGLFRNGRPDPESGIGLAGVYLVWVSVVVALFPICRWYGKFKRKNNHLRFLRYI